MTTKFSGQKIRVMRKAMDMSIKELAEKSQLSTGLISQIERDLVSPSVNAMMRIVDALDTTMGEFFDDEFIKEDPIVMGRTEHKEILLSSMDRKYTLLSPTDSRILEMIVMHINPKTDLDTVLPRVHEGEECGFILEGALVVEVDGIQYELLEGESIYFEATKPHRYLNLSNEESVSIWSFTPPSY